MIHVASPLVWDPSFTSSSAQRSHKSDTDSSKMSTQTPQEALKPISKKRRGHEGEILGRHTATKQTQAA